MPGASIFAALENRRNQYATEKLRRRALRDASDPLSYPSEIFISYYRVNKEAFVMVLEQISSQLQRSSIPATLQLATTLRFLATGSFQNVIGKVVDISLARTTVSTIIWRVIKAAENVLCPQWIKLEMSNEERHRSKTFFFEKYQIPGIVGCIYGTHIKLSKPSEDESLFLNRKGTYSINAMIICDYKMKVRAVDSCRPGSCHDSFIWNMSSARTYFLNEYSNGNKNSWLLGDSGYGLEPFLITPFKNVTAGTIEHKFNKKHASCRNIIERTIGVLKSRFRCLQGTSRSTPEKVVKITNVCCALHNICREYNIHFEEDTVAIENEDIVEIDEEVPERLYYNVAQRLRNDIASQINYFIE